MEQAQDPKWQGWLYRQHSFNELSEWTRALRYFRYVRALGGHANDGDQLLCALRCASDADFLRLMSALGLEPKPLPQAELERARHANSPNRFGPSKQWLSTFEQPRNVTLAGVPVFVYGHAEQLELSLSGAAGDPYEVTRTDVDNAARIEQSLGALATDVVLPPRPGPHCFAITDGGPASAAGTRTD